MNISVRKIKRVCSLVLKSIIVILAVLSVINRLQMDISHRKVAARKHPSVTGYPNIFREYEVYCSNVFDPVVAGSNLYLYYPHQNLLQVFDLSGEYSYSVKFPDDSTSGSSYFYAKDDNFYFVNHNTGGIYYFESGQFVEHIQGDEAYKLRNELRSRNGESCNIDEEGNVYRLQGSSVVRFTEFGDETVVIQRPAWMYIFQNPPILTYASLIFFVLLWMYAFKRRW